MKKRNSDADTLSVPEAARRLGVSANLLYEQCREGKFPCIVIGGRTLISKAKLGEILSAGNYTPAAPVTGEGGAHVDQG